MYTQLSRQLRTAKEGLRQAVGKGTAALLMSLPEHAPNGEEEQIIRAEIEEMVNIRISLANLILGVVLAAGKMPAILDAQDLTSDLPSDSASVLPSGNVSSPLIVHSLHSVLIFRDGLPIISTVPLRT